MKHNWIIGIMAVFTLAASSCTRERFDVAHQGESPLQVISLPPEVQPQSTRAFINWQGHVEFNDLDTLGLFLRNDASSTYYHDVDNRMVVYDSIPNQWHIDGNPIILSSQYARVTAYYPYHPAATLDNVPLSAGSYAINGNDLVWKRESVNWDSPKMHLLALEHARARVRIKVRQRP